MIFLNTLPFFFHPCPTISFKMPSYPRTLTYLTISFLLPAFINFVSKFLTIAALGIAKVLNAGTCLLKLSKPSCLEWAYFFTKRESSASCTHGFSTAISDSLDALCLSPLCKNAILDDRASFVVHANVTYLVWWNTEHISSNAYRTDFNSWKDDIALREIDFCIFSLITTAFDRKTNFCFIGRPSF